MRSTGQAKAPDQKIRRSHDLPRLFSVILNPAHPAVQGQSIREVIVVTYRLPISFVRVNLSSQFRSQCYE
jgi:hypothetical protein